MLDNDICVIEEDHQLEIIFADKDHDQIKIIKDDKINTSMRLSSFNQKAAFYTGKKLFEISTK